MFDYSAYAIGLRRQLHRRPEIGFDLPETLALVRRELDAMGIPYTETYGKSSIVATVNPECKGFTIGLRGDMDALPIQEKTNCEFKSEIDGQMHACGHDLHTAILLGAARKLVDMKDQLRCRVKLLFTPAEEYITPGCKLMAEDGVMDDIDCAIGAHVITSLPTGHIATRVGGANANSMGMTAEFFGTSVHANVQQRGVDAIRMAVEAYTAMENMVAKELSPTEPRLLNIGVFQGGQTNNVICDYCKLFLTSRAHTDEVTEFMRRRIEEICTGIAAIHGGSAKVTVNKLLPFVLNNEKMVAAVRQTAQKMLGQSCVHESGRGLGGEDFGYLSRKKPCAFYYLGARADDVPGSDRPLHSADIVFDERCVQYGIDLFTQFVVDHQDGIDLT